MWLIAVVAISSFGIFGCGSGGAVGNNNSTPITFSSDCRGGTGGSDAGTGGGGGLIGVAKFGGTITFVDVDTPDQTGTLDVSGGLGETPGTDGTTMP